MTDFLLELRSEEIPARMQVKAKDDLARLFADEIAKAGLTATAIETFATPRRLALIARGLPEATAAVSEERKGPRSNAPEQALAGFLRSTGLTREQLVERDGVFFAVIDKPGRPTAEILPPAVCAVVASIPWQTSMRWGEGSSSLASIKWVRPLQGVVAILGEDVLEFELPSHFEVYERPDGSSTVRTIGSGIKSGATTMGHRFHHSGPITIGSAADYVEKLRTAHVIVHLSERTTLIRDGARAAAAAEGLVLVEDEGLVVENAGLTEWPVPLLGRFDPDFLGVPREVIQLTMRTNQKYFACTNASGALANAFVCTANIDASDGGTAIVAGNRKVLAARLSDAKFFWENDLKVPLATQAEKLSGIVFHEKLGTVADKVERVAKLAEWLATEKIVPNCDPALARKAAELCKADLVTGMVGEFPELQGIIGGHLARAQGLPDAVADAIRDHYKPVGQGDDVPTAPVTVAVSLADKLDTLFRFFAADLAPTGSKDPFALRRAALGVVAIVLANKLPLSLSAAIRFSIPANSPMKDGEGLIYGVPNLGEKSYHDNVIAKPFDDLKKRDGESLSSHDFVVSPPEAVFGSITSFNFEDVCQKILNFFADRLKVQQREAGVRHDLIDAVFALGGEDDLVRLLARVKALQAFVGTAEGANLLAGYKRAANILKKSPSPSGERDSAGLQPAQGEGASEDSVPHPVRAARVSTLSPEGEGEEVALIAALDTAEPLAAAAIDAEDFEAAMSALATLRTPMDAFFENVTVNDPDPTKRSSRLALLARFRDAVHRIADFSKIEG